MFLVTGAPTLLRALTPTHEKSWNSSTACYTYSAAATINAGTDSGGTKTGQAAGRRRQTAEEPLQAAYDSGVAGYLSVISACDCRSARSATHEQGRRVSTGMLQVLRRRLLQRCATHCVPTTIDPPAPRLPLDNHRAQRKTGAKSDTLVKRTSFPSPTERYPRQLQAVRVECGAAKGGA